MAGTIFLHININITSLLSLLLLAPQDLRVNLWTNFRKDRTLLEQFIKLDFSIPKYDNVFTSVHKTSWL